VVGIVNTQKCPGFNMPRKRPRSYATNYRCEECTQEKGVDFWLCNTTKKVDEVETILDCHAKYHVERKLFITTTSTASSENSVISDLTEE
jgi:S-methylmethionine-dependent homocysteine/selenocysteine methylase